MPVEQILNAAKEVSISDFFATFFSILQYPAVTLLTAMLLDYSAYKRIMALI